MVWKRDTWEAREHVFGRDTFSYEGVQRWRYVPMEEVGTKAVQRDEDCRWGELMRAVGYKRQRSVFGRFMRCFEGSEGEEAEECCYRQQARDVQCSCPTLRKDILA